MVVSASRAVRRLEFIRTGPIMRQVAAYRIDTAPEETQADTLLAEFSQAVVEWLSSKGTLAPDLSSLILPTGVIADLQHREITSDSGLAREWSLQESIPGGAFRTRIRATSTTSGLSATIQLSTASSDMTPNSRVPHTPRLIQNLLLGKRQWKLHGWPLKAVPLALRGTEGGNEAVSLITSPERPIPVIAISEDDGFTLHPDLDTRLARELAGVAQVVRIDDGASRHVSRSLGQQWSCFGGAIRIYWPKLDLQQSPFMHFLWTSQRLRFEFEDTEEAANQIRLTLRRRVLEQASLWIGDPELFSRIQSEAQSKAMRELADRAREASYSDAFVDSFTEQFDQLVTEKQQLEDDNAKLRDENQGLRYEVQGLREALRQRRPQGQLEPAHEATPDTLADVLSESRRRFGSLLAFGESVAEGIRGLRDEPSIAAKVFDSIQALAELARAYQTGQLGKTVVKWLEDQGEDASTESTTILNSAKQMRARTWDDGTGTRREFNLHLKPMNATAPDRCARIYFHPDPENGRVLIGWIGRHPPEL